LVYWFDESRKADVTGMVKNFYVGLWFFFKYKFWRSQKARPEYTESGAEEISTALTVLCGLNIFD
jgi:hypothetical protein